jgi:hypothetical protein
VGSKAYLDGKGSAIASPLLKIPSPFPVKSFLIHWVNKKKKLMLNLNKGLVVASKTKSLACIIKELTMKAY